MKSIIQMIGCLSIVLLLSTSTVFSGSGKLSGEMQKKEKTNNSGWVGIVIQDVTEKNAKKAKLDSEEGAYVKDVVDDSPADSAGIQDGDIIIELNGKKIFDSDELAKYIRRTSPGTKIEVLVVRDGQKKKLNLFVGRNKMSKHEMFGVIPDIPDVRVFVRNHTLGLQLTTLNDQLGEYFGVPDSKGVLVEEVKSKSTAEKAGFKAGDIITRIGNKAVDATEKVQKELRKYDEGDKVEFEIYRKGAKKTISLEMEENQSVPQNFFFRKPHIRMFRMNPFDDAAMRLNMDEIRSELDHAQIECCKSLEYIREYPKRQMKVCNSTD